MSQKPLDYRSAFAESVLCAQLAQEALELAVRAHRLVRRVHVHHVAARELEEETGFRAGRIENLGEFFSSPGMVSECFHLMRAHDLERVHAGGGVAGEEISVHVVPLAELDTFIAAKRSEGCGIDVKLLLLLGAKMLG